MHHSKGQQISHPFLKNPTRVYWDGFLFILTQGTFSAASSEGTFFCKLALPSCSLAEKQHSAANTQNYCFCVAKDSGDWKASWAFHIHEIGTGAPVPAASSCVCSFSGEMKEILCKRMWGLERPHPFKDNILSPIQKGWMVYANNKETLRAVKEKNEKSSQHAPSVFRRTVFLPVPLLWYLHACKQWKVSGKGKCPVWVGGGRRVWSEWMHLLWVTHQHIYNLHEQFQEQEDTVSLLLLMKFSGSGYFPWINL